MMGFVRRGLVVAAVVLAVTVAASPSWGQTNTYTGVTPPAAGSVVAPQGIVQGGVVQGGLPSVTGERPVVPLQVSGGAVGGTAQGRAGGLALTGADIAGLVAIGVFATALGVVLVSRARPDSTPRP